MTTTMIDCFEQLTLWNLGPQQVTVTFQGGRIISDTGLLGIRKLDKELHVFGDNSSQGWDYLRIVRTGRRPGLGVRLSSYSPALHYSPGCGIYHTSLSS